MNLGALTREVSQSNGKLGLGHQSLASLDLGGSNGRRGRRLHLYIALSTSQGVPYG